MIPARVCNDGKRGDEGSENIVTNLSVRAGEG